MERRTISVSELIITGGTQTPLEGEFAYDSDEISEALKSRQARLAEMKESKAAVANKQAAPKKTGAGFDLGF